MTKPRWLVFLAVAAIVAAALGFWAVRPLPTAPQTLALPDGSAVRILGASYGTTHVLGGPLARCLARLPSPVRFLLGNILGGRAVNASFTTTPTPALVVWLERTTNNPSRITTSGYMEARLSDAAGFVSGEGLSLNAGWWSSPESVIFRAFPRRERTIRLVFFYNDSQGKVAPSGDLPFRNPQRGSFPNWKPDLLPVTKRAGDVEVTLKQLSTGQGWNTTYRSVEGGGNVIEFDSAERDGRNGTVCEFQLKSLTDTNQEWCVANVEVSDATGNKLQNNGMTWGGESGQGYIRFEPGLWTNEPAWKLRCEIKRTKGFASGETFVFEHVPLGTLERTNVLSLSTNIAGVTVMLDHIFRRAPSTNSSWSSSDLSRAYFSASGLTNGMHLDLLTTRTDMGTKLDCLSWSSSGTGRDYAFHSIPVEVKTADFTFAVQRSRWVEFLVKPEVGVARIRVK